MSLETLIPYIVSGITAIAGFFVGRKKQKNDFLADQQSSINLLSDENKKLLEEVVKLRNENVELKYELAEVKAIVLDLQRQMKKK